MTYGIIKVSIFSVLISFIASITEVPSWSNQAFAATEGSEEVGDPAEKKKKPLSARRYYSLEPFTVPLMASGQIKEQFTIVLSIELTDEDHRIEIAYAIPRIRHEVYNELLHLVTFRRRGDTIPQIAIFKKLLSKVAMRVVGDKAKGVVIQQAFKAQLN